MNTITTSKLTDRGLHSVNGSSPAPNEGPRRSFFEILDGGRKRPGTQYQPEVVGFLLAELAFDYTRIIDAAG